MALMLRGLIANKVSCTKKKHVFIKQHDFPDHNLNVGNVTYIEWKAVQSPESKRWKQVECHLKKDESVVLFKKTACSLREHVQRVKKQYKQMQELKKKLGFGEMTWFG